MAAPTGNNANLTAKRLNVLVYSGALNYSAHQLSRLLTDSGTIGTGTTVDSVRHCVYTLRRLLASHYAVTPVTGDMLLNEPWTATCALLVIPGGADLGYGRTLNGAGNRRIIQFVRRGGRYLGLCAGGYYGCKKCEFEVGDKTMEVIGERELAFYPGTCRGGAFPGFVYHSENGARAAGLDVSKEALGVDTAPTHFRSYYNGGGVFVDAPKFKDQGVEVLANYSEKLNVDPGEGAAAVVYCKVGDGAAILTGPHPEYATRSFSSIMMEYHWLTQISRFAAVNLNPNEGGSDYKDVVDAIAADDKERTEFLKACLLKLGLQVAQDISVPSLSSLHVSGLDAEVPLEILSLLAPSLTNENDNEYLKDENDTFRIERPGAWKLSDLEEALPTDGDGIVDYQTVTKRLVIHDELPSSKLTPYFNHHAFYSNLRQYQSESRGGASEFGSNLMYGEVVTSTNTILEK
jgi:biotin--protein ligase